MNLETAVERARVGCDAVRWRGATTLRAVSPVITRETTMWQAWIGFNASHDCLRTLAVAR